MANFIVEDGSGRPDATSYLTVAFADEYLGATWAQDNSAKEEALIAATEYQEARWGHVLRGVPLVHTQALEMPRARLYDRYGRQVNGIPDDFKKATAIYAKHYVAGSLYPTPPSGNAKEAKRKKTTVGPITTEVEFQGAATTATFLPFPLADRMVRQFGTGATGGTIRN